MTIRDVQLIDTRGRIDAERDTRVYIVALLIWFVAISLLLYEIFDIRPAAAQTACGDRAAILDDLARFHLETPQAIGLSADGKVIEILVSPSGSWSILVNHPNRQSCVVAIGENWQSLPNVATESAI